MTSRAHKQQELKSVTSDIENSKQAVKDAQRLLSGLESRQRELVEELSPKKTSRPSVSDHAVLRFLERKYNLDIEEYRQSILTSAVVAAIEAGALSIKVDGMKYVVADKVIVTVLD